MARQRRAGTSARTQSRRLAKRASSPNALGQLIEACFITPGFPCRSYRELVLRSGVSYAALRHYCSVRPSFYRSPSVAVLARLEIALGVNIEALCRATAQGITRVESVTLPGREEQLVPWLGQLTEEQFDSFLALMHTLLETPRSAEAL